MIPRRTLLAALAITTSTLALTGCSGSSSTISGSASAKTGTLVFSPPALAIPTLKSQSELVTGLAKAAGWKTTVVDPNFDPATQVQQVQQAINSGQADAVWIIPADVKALSGVISLAQSKGVPIALTAAPKDFGFSGAQRGIVFDSADYGAYGSAIATAAADCVTSKLDGNAEVLLVTQNATQSGAADQEKGIRTTLAEKAPGAKIVATGFANTKAAAQTKVSQLLQSHPNAKAVIATADEDALGAIGAYEAAGKELPCVVDGGGGQEAMQAVKVGDMYAVVAFDYSADAKNVFANIQKLAKHPKGKGAVGSVPIVTTK